MKTLRTTLLIGAALGLLLTAGIVASQVSAEAGTATAQVGSATIEVDGDASVDLRALGVGEPGLGAWSIDVSYDTDVIAAVGCEPENGSVCNPAFTASSVRVTGAVAEGIEGDTLLASIRFRCVDLGSSALTQTINVLADATIGDPQELKTTVQDGSITCTESVPPTPGPTSEPPPPGGSASFVKPGATYIGDIGGGGTIEITVNATGSGVSFIKIDNFSTPCGLVSQIFTVDPPVPIQGNEFSHQFLAGEDFITVTGEFLSNRTIEGLILLSPEDPACNQDPRAYVATCVEPPPAPPVSAPPIAGTGPSLASFSMVDWYIAGLVGAGIAWLVAGLSGAGIVLAGRGRSPHRVQRPEAPAAKPAANPNGTGVPEFVALRPRRAAPCAAAAPAVRPAPAPPARTPRAHLRAEVSTNSIPSFVSLRRRYRG